MTTAMAGWYPQEDGQLRYWDGTDWTDHFHDPDTVVAQRGLGGKAAVALKRVAERQPLSGDDTIWSGVGRPLTGLGAGRYRITSHYIFFERGMLRTDSQQAPISAVLDVDVKQSMSQKARGLFTLVVHIQRATGIEFVTLEDVPDGREAQRVINETAHRARLSIQERGNTHTYRHEGNPSMPVTLAAIPADSVPDFADQIRKLGDLHVAGILTDDEFATKKAEILARM